MDQRLSIITLAVKDLAKSEAFYKGVFGWTRNNEEVGIAFYQLNGFQFSLYPASEMAKEHGDNIRAPAGLTLAYNVNSKQEVDDLFAMFASKDVIVLKQPEEVFWGGYSGYIAGPDGEQWEIAFNPFTQVNDDGTFGS